MPKYNLAPFNKREAQVTITVLIVTFILLMVLAAIVG